MKINVDDIVEIKINSRMRKRATKLAEKKLGYKYDENGKLAKTGDDRIYDRYNYPRKERYKKIYLGEMAEEACKEFIDTLGLEYICYNDVRIDEFKDDDPFDFKFGDILVDLKSSKDNRDHGLEQILKNQNLIVPIDQTIKNIIIQAFIDNPEKRLWVCCWATYNDIKREENIGYLHWQPGKYYKMQIQTCRPLNELKEYLILKGATER